MAVNSTKQCLRPLATDNNVDEKSGATYVKMTKVKYTWTIHNFSCLHKKVGEILNSPTFSAGANNEYKWQLNAYPNGDRSESSDHLSLYLRFVPSEKSEAEATFTFCLLDGKKKEINVLRLLAPKKFEKSSLSTGWSQFVKKSFLQDAANCLLLDDSLTISCNISIYEGIAEISDSEELKVPKCRLLDDLSDLFESMKFSDVTLITPSREFQAHKLILATRSPVFSVMFQHDMLEQKTNRVDITDMDDAVLTELLRFIYTEKIMNLDKMAAGLLAAADKYQLERLKDLCEKALSQSITTENAASLLILGDLHNCVQLKARALKFICTDTKEVFETASYKSILATHPHLMAEIFKDFIKKTISTNSNVATPK